MTEPRIPYATPSHPGVYDEIGRSYEKHRRPEPRIAAQIERALGDARTLCNVGAGAGSYEPADREVVALDPSVTMLAKRSAAAAPRVRGVAEALPFPDRAFDAALVVLSLHHWLEPLVGLAEVRRIAKRRVVFHFDSACHYDYWLIRDYFPEMKAIESAAPSTGAVAEALGGGRVEEIPVPHDCVDGFLCAYWRRPEAYLDPEVRACISVMAQMQPAIIERGIRELEADLSSGRWLDRNGALLDQAVFDGGYRLIIAAEAA